MTSAPLSTPAHLRPQLAVHRLGMAHPGDLSALAALFDAGTMAADEVVAVIGKTEGNGGVNDFTRGYFTQSLMQLLAERTGRPAEAIWRELPCVLSGGTEGVLSPHYVVFSRRMVPADAGCSGGSHVVERETRIAPGTAADTDAPARREAVAPGALAIGTAFSPPTPAQDIGRWTHVRAVAHAVRAAMDQAGIDRPEDVAFVQLKCPCVTSARAQAAVAAGHTVLTADPGRSMAFARAAGAFGAAIALGELPDDPALEGAMLRDFDRFSARASVSSGVEVSANEVIVLGHSARWQGPLRMGCAPMRDALDIAAVGEALRPLGLQATPQLPADQATRVAAVFVKCEPDRRGQVRGTRHTMLDDTDINAQRHIRGAVGGLVAGVLGDGRLFVSGGAEHQGPDGGGLVAVIADVG
ncbi:cyanuric acid amidohydrolase [Pseudacidovorax intermedius]|uniref:Cyclic amide hydrolase n=1 Tax=Pseudacidovorax intermedius TaxID=433924 RepID=A0A370FNX0_9BURK|nr:ring-opening amidohydrolase [Pseudacidovorax intermedius]RDI29422.1 cyanuric acid amidohydrolase [Pseudacidovorax intermedius]